MSVTRRVTFRLYPNTAQERQLFEWKRLHCYLYNACVEHRRTSYQKFGKSVNYFDQQNALPAFKECWGEYQKLGSHALQATVKRVDFAFARFFKLKTGYPRFKANRRYGGVHNCEKCSYRCDRDVAAAMVMLNFARGQELSSSVVESPNPTECGNMRQFGALKRQKLADAR